VTVQEMCSGKPWPALCESMNSNPVPWFAAAAVLALWLYWRSFDK
jgi:hypothetical protein